MSTRTIEVDADTLARLNDQRRGDEPLGQTIRRLTAPAAPPPPTADPIRTVADLQAWFAEMEADPLGDEAAAAIEQVIADRELPANKLDPWADALLSD